MKVRVDPARCEGYGTCAAILAAVFVLDEWGYASAAGDGEVPEGMVEAAREAVASCPVHAIIVDEDLAG